MSGPIPSFNDILASMCCPPLATDAEIAARRRKLEIDLRAEGACDATVERLATDESAERMLNHEKQTLAQIAKLFTPEPYTQCDKLRDQWSCGRQI